MNWNEPLRAVRVDLDQARLRQLGLTQSDVAGVLADLFEGGRVTQLRQGRDQVDVLTRGNAQDRTSFNALKKPANHGIEQRADPAVFDCDAALGKRTADPLSAQPRARGHRGAAIATDDQPASLGGSVDESADSQAPIVAAVPAMIFVILLLMMMQVQSFRTMLVIMAVAPPGLIGVVAAMLL